MSESCNDSPAATVTGGYSDRSRELGDQVVSSEWDSEQEKQEKVLTRSRSLPAVKREWGRGRPRRTFADTKQTTLKFQKF